MLCICKFKHLILSQKCYITYLVIMKGSIIIFKTTLEAIQEDTVQALQNKNPAVKLETNAFLARAFSKTSFKIMSDKKLMKPYFTAIVANLNEPGEYIYSRMLRITISHNFRFPSGLNLFHFRKKMIFRYSISDEL